MASKSPLRIAVGLMRSKSSIEGRAVELKIQLRHKRRIRRATERPGVLMVRNAKLQENKSVASEDAETPQNMEWGPQLQKKASPHSQEKIFYMSELTAGWLSGRSQCINSTRNISLNSTRHF